MNAMTTDWRLEARETVASLPMYDFPELREAHDALWRALRLDLAGADVDRIIAPALLRGDAGEGVWRDPRLLLTQVCGYPLALGLRGRLRVVATPGYSARGCQGPHHRSAILVRLRDPAVTLADVRGRRLALNAPDSNTGMNLLRAEVAPLARGARFFSGVVETGAHARSVAAVAEGLGDLAAVDCVSWAHLERLAPALCGRLRVLAWTRSSPGLPLVTGPLTGDGDLAALRGALDRATLDPTLKEARSALLLDRFHDIGDRAYPALVRLRDDAAAEGYPDLV